MKSKKSIMLLFFLFVHLFSHAQPLSIIKGEAMKEPDGIVKLLVLDNGNVLYLETYHYGTTVKLFDPSCKFLKENSIVEPQETEIFPDHVINFFQIGNELILFVNKSKELEVKNGISMTGQSFLFRYIFDVNTLELKKQDELCEINTNDNFPLGHEKQTHMSIFFFAEKSVNNDGYAVCAYNRRLASGPGSMEVIHYDVNHNEINRYTLSPQGDKPNYLRCLGLYVKGTEYLAVAAVTTNGNKKTGFKNNFYLSKIAPGNKKIEYLDLGINSPYSEHFGELAPSSDAQLTLVVKSCAYREKTVSFFVCVNPDQMSLSKMNALTFSKANQDYISRVSLKETKTYEAEPQDFFADRKGNNLIMSFVTDRYIVNTGSGTADYTSMENLAITSVQNNGQEKFGIILPHIDFNASDYQYEFLMANRRIGPYWAGSYDQKKTLSIGHGKSPLSSWEKGYLVKDLRVAEKNVYVFANNLPVNFQSEPSKKTKSILNINATTPFYYKINLTTGEMKSDYLLTTTTPGYKGFCNFSASGYNPVTKEYYTLLIETVGVNKNAYLIKFTAE